MQFAIPVEVYDSLVSGTDQASSGFFHDQGNHSEATLQVPKYILKHSVRLTFFFLSLNMAKFVIVMFLS